MPFYATKHTDYECPHCHKAIQVPLLFTGGDNFSVGCFNCSYSLWNELDIQNSDVPRTINHFPTPRSNVDIELIAAIPAPRASFTSCIPGFPPSAEIWCDACNLLHPFNQSTLDSAYNAITDEWRYSCSNNMSQSNPLANKSLNTLMHLDRWIEKQIVIQKNPLNQRYATNPVNPANYANVLIRDMVPPSEESKSTQYGGLSREEWDALKPWQQFKHLDKIKNPSHYYQEGQPLF